jgi:CheY-like chemotaxis protein
MKPPKVRPSISGPTPTVEAMAGQENEARKRPLSPNRTVQRPVARDMMTVVAALWKEASWRDIPVIVITSRDLDAKDRERLNSGLQSVLVKETFRPADLVECIRRLLQDKPTITSRMEAAS